MFRNRLSVPPGTSTTSSPNALEKLKDDDSASKSWALGCKGFIRGVVVFTGCFEGLVEG